MDFFLLDNLIFPEEIVKVHHLLVLAPISLAFLACGPAPDDSNDPPQIIGGLMGEVSPFDTLAVEFTTDLETIAKSQIESDQKLKWSQKDKRVYIFGDSSLAGVQMLEPNKKYTVTFKKLKSTDGETQDEAQPLQFTTMPILDKDGKKEGTMRLSNDDYGNAEVLATKDAFFNRASLTEGLSVAGILSGIANGVGDSEDWFEIKLKYGDSFDIKLTNLKADLKLEVYGPESPSGTMADSIDLSNNRGKADEHVVLKPDANRHVVGSENLKDYLSYWIRVSPAEGEKVISSYVLTVKKMVK